MPAAAPKKQEKDTEDEPREATAAESWRLEHLLECGYTDIQAGILAMRIDIDLHRACDLARLAGPDTAFQILY